MKLHDLLDVWKLNDMIAAGYVRFGTHQEFPELRIFEYTTKAVIDRVWNDVTMKTRGLIVNMNTKEILARPFDKFFNYGQPEQKIKLYPDDEVEVYDKLDGSLGILYRRPDGQLAIATKGSFHSEQADWATKEIRKYMTTHFHEDEYTWMFEIIYPENRIVVTYDFSGLVLLGVRDIEEGDVAPPEDVLDWHGRKATHFRYKTLREALEATPRPNAEGFVIFVPDMDLYVKVKQEDYLKLHKTVFSFGVQYMYDRISDGQSLQYILDGLPDEMHKEASDIYHGLCLRHAMIRSRIRKQHAEIYREGMSREEYAAKAMEYPDWSLMFKLYDKDITFSEDIWDSLNPKAVKRKEKKSQKPRKKKLSVRQRRELAMQADS